MGLSIAMEHISPQWRDPEYGYKLRELKDRLREDPDRPLMLVIGSSRSGLGVSPDEFHLEGGAGSKAPIVFNMAISGSGPLFELMSLKRVLGEGIRPRWVMLEVLAPLLYQEPAWSEWNWLNVNRLSLSDVLLLSRYSDDPRRLQRHWLESRIAPSYSHRFYLMGQYFPAWLPLDLRNDAWWQIDGYGYRTAPMPDVVVGPTRARLVANAKREYFHALQNFKVAEKSNRAMREIMDTCKANDLPVLVYLMPEGAEFRSWYKPGTAEAIQAYLDTLKRDYQVDIVDARTWFEERVFLRQPSPAASGRPLILTTLFPRPSEALVGQPPRGSSGDQADAGQAECADEHSWRELRTRATHFEVVLFPLLSPKGINSKAQDKRSAILGKAIK